MKKKTESKPSVQLPARLTAHQSFTYEEIDRSLIQTVEWNPRVISDQNRKMLTQSLKKKGLCEPLILNKRNNHLLGGHQRLSILDQLEGSPNYKIGVACVDLTETEEIELNLALNSPNLQGHYAADSFFDLLKTPHLDLDAIGFTTRDVQLEFGDVPVDIMDILQPGEKHSSDILNPLLNPSLPSSITDQISDLEGDKKRASGEPQPIDRNSPEALKERKQEYKESDSSNPVHDTDYSLQLIFNSHQDREKFLAHNRLRSLSRFVTADELIPLLKDPALWR